ncbi:MAG: DNA-directed RNA polymerase subunit alpha [Candidatus Pacebacteria bacterium]|nr:DNA-directed RNA polymerase subunit alpha [Candidatus Paceibacterota bacterium]MCD8507878.1 DNA-directed RNA polymerase subunit alpha [Candidatus Paceibacterota bacterium]MCD8563933.1 DNA-directed RNA polymerase subunit alpha [Candidatus Paceibacterota bacterium]
MEDSTILLPSQLKVVKEDNFNGSYEIEGLYPGYGHTLGNSLRRIILSSLPGAAITSVRITGADHEYATLENIKEDVIAILLNLRQIRFRLDTDEAQVAKISMSGAGVVTAQNVVVPGGLEVLNPEQYIAEITDKKGSLDIEVTVERGLGFVSKEKLSKEKLGIGTIMVDAVFTPIRKVSYEVEDMRVGDRTDHNRLRLNIQTDGTLTPREALERAIKTMIRQLRSIIDLKEALENIPVIEPAALAERFKEVAETEVESSVDHADVLKTRIDSVDLSTRTLNALTEASIRTIGGLVRKSEEDLLELDGIGKKGVEEIKAVLNSFGLALQE